MMLSLAIILLSVTVALSYSYSNRTRIKACFSFGCKRNRNGRCSLKEIIVYDNGAMGICLKHTSSMQERILDPMLKGMELGKKDGEIETLGKIAQALSETESDVKLLQDKEMFAKWLKQKVSEGNW